MLKKHLKLDSTINTLNQKVEELTAELAAHKNSSDSMNNELRQNTEALAKLKQDSIASEDKYSQLNNKYTSLNTNYTLAEY